MMTVKELREALSGCPPDVEVRIQTEDENAHRIGDVLLLEPGQYIPFECDEEDGQEPVVFVASDWLAG